MSKKKQLEQFKKQAAAIKAQGCFRCDGTGQLCNVCGESARACGCPEEEQNFYECPDCKGKENP